MNSPTTIILYGIPNCDTVKKARAWLQDQGLACQFHDFKKQGVPAERLAGWMAAVGWEKLLNRQGTTWRRLDAAVQARAQDAESAAALMREHPSVIKRPVVEWSGTPTGRVTVGFKADAWRELAAGA
ncbi:ArsC family reductase [Oryzisolibacter sp. LB2S]|uniref:ArsC family reductase n=1 Tax=Alicycliphilus soli TaxID=3228789 RepID=UPI003457BAB2